MCISYFLLALKITAIISNLCSQECTSAHQVQYIILNVFFLEPAVGLW